MVERAQHQLVAGCEVQRRRQVAEQLRRCRPDDDLAGRCVDVLSGRFVARVVQIRGFAPDGVRCAELHVGVRQVVGYAAKSVVIHSILLYCKFNSGRPLRFNHGSQGLASTCIVEVDLRLLQTGELLACFLDVENHG